MTEIQHKTKKTVFDHEVPNLVEVQIKSYEWFLKEGFKEVLDSFSPITNYDRSYSLEFIGDPIFEEPNNTEEECRRNMTTYDGAIKVKVQVSKRDEKGVITSTVEDIHLAYLPKMTANGTFFINGAERVVVSQLYRSPGAYFDDNFDNTGKQLYFGKIQPSDGSWLEIHTDNNELKAKIGQSAVFPVTILLRSFNQFHDLCPYPVDSLLGKTFKDIHFLDEKEEDECKKGFDFKDNKGDILVRLVPAKNKRSPEYETTVIEPKHIEKLKEYFGDYVYTSNFNSISTASDILNLFGYKDFVKISRLFPIRNYKKENNAVKEIENEVISVPCKDKDDTLNGVFRVLSVDILNEKGKVLFKKGTKFDDPKLIMPLPKNSIFIGGQEYDRNGCIEYLVTKGLNDKYREAIDGIECTEENILLEWLVREQTIIENTQKVKPLYNIVNMCPVNDIIDEETGEVLCNGTGIIRDAVADYLYNNSESVYLEVYNVPQLISKTLNNENPKPDVTKGIKPVDPVVDDKTALLAFQRFLRPLEPASEEAAKSQIINQFIDNKNYNLGKVGRYKLNRKLGLNLPVNAKVCRGSKYKAKPTTREDLIKLIKYTIYLSKEGKIVTDYFPERKQAILDKISEYIRLVKKGKINGVDSITVKETIDQSDSQKGSKILVNVSRSKYSKTEDKILDGRNAMYARFYSLIENMEYGSLFTKDEYIRLTEFLKAVNEDFDGECPYLESALSDSPQNLRTEYVLARVNLCITDEIDNLENKRVRPVGELLQERLIEGIKRMEKNVLDKMNQSDREKMAVNNLINSKPISGALKGFFGTDQLSQFMDQTNPLAELTHKRRLSSLGRGGLMRQSAKIEVRDVHHSHYGRICPIETPEGPNIGLIGSMAIHARINDFGFIETPYRIVRNGVITDEIRYFSAEEESHEYIANAGIAYDEETKQIIEKNTVVRHNGKYPRVDCQKITLMEVSPNQIMSVAANLIPFIENDDANRALMGSNMQRQAVPLLKPTAPIVRTGIEKKAAHDSGVEQFAKRAGKVVWVSCENIVVLPEEPDYTDRYEITFTKKKKYDHRDNLFTCVKKTYAFGDKEYKNLLSETIIPVNSVINRTGKSSEINLDGTDYLCIDPEKNTVALIPVCENLEKGDLIFDGKIYRGKNKKYEFTGYECDCFSGIVSDIKTVQVPVEENSEETEEKIKLEISELDLYSMVPEIVRSAFPPAYAVIRFGKIEIVSDTAGVGCGNNNKVVLENPAENQWVFDVTVCDSNRLINMTRSNQGTCINSRAVVEIGRRVYKDELLADGPCTDHGELALGQNVTVAFLPWNGYNYEDAILLNEKLVKDDKFSSVHIEKYEIEARDTKNGAEEITRDIPNVKEDDLKDLDERGIIRIGAHVKAEGFLVGKIAPKGAKEPDSYDKLTRSIFGNNAELKRDVSLKVPHGESGTIVDVKVFSRYKFQCSNPDCSFTKEFCKKPEPEECFCEVCNSPLKQLPSDEINAGVNQLVRVYIAQKRKITKGDKMAGRHGNKGVISNIIQEADMPFKPDGVPVDIVLNPLGVPSRMNIGQILETHQGYAGTHLGLKFKNPIFQSSTEREIIADLEIMTSKKLVDTLLAYLKELEINVKVSDRKILKALNESIELVTEATGDELDKVADPLNNLKASVYEKVLAAVKEYDAYDLEILSRNLCCDQVIFDDSPEFETKLEQIKELNHAKFKAENSEDSLTDEECGMDSLASVLDSLTEAKSDVYEIPADYNYEKLIDAMEKVIIKRVGFHAKLAKTDLYDGKTGDKLHQSVCVGTIYMLKLHHLVDDKIHARATGPYSLVTQQPLGGKAQFGGQRFGEMEVWALEAYGAAYTLQEILTIKSDDVLGRVDTYESIVKGENIPLAGIPESFKILVNELQSLCLKITIEDKNGNAIDIRTYDDTPLKG